MKVFLSYSSTDRELADRLRERLAREGFEVWSDRELAAGESWVQGIEAAVRAADAILVLVGPQERNDEAQRFTWSAALQASWEDESRPLLPIVVGNAELPAFLKARQAIRLQTASDPDLDRAAAAISQVLRGLPGASTRSFSLTFSVPDEDDREERLMRFSELQRMAHALRH